MFAVYDIGLYRTHVFHSSEEDKQAIGTDSENVPPGDQSY